MVEPLDGGMLMFGADGAADRAVEIESDGVRGGEGLLIRRAGSPFGEGAAGQLP